MKRLTFLMVSFWLMGVVGLVLAQTPILTPTPPPANTNLDSASVTRSQIKARIKAQVARVNADAKVGKSTTAQAGAFLADLKAIKDKLKADYAENGKKELNNDQKVELNAMLDASEKNIGERNGLQNFN